MRSVILISVLLAVPFTAFAQIKRPQPPPKEPSYSSSLQAVVVTTANWVAHEGTARLFERKSATSGWRQIGGEFPVVVGRNGLAIDATDAWQEEAGAPPKREGDGKAPAGIIPLTFAFGRPEKPADVKLPYTRLEEFTECVDDVDSHHYNKIVHRLQVGIFDWKSSEKMLAVGDQYDLGVFVAYNSYPAVRGRGSCIFLHVWKDVDSGTAGCTAMARENLEKVVKWLDPAKNPHLIQMPLEVYTSYRRKWNLPKL